MAFFSALLVVFMSTGVVQAGSLAVGPLEGEWVAQEMVSSGQQVPAFALQGMRLTFKGDKVTIRTPGRIGEAIAEETCAFTIDGSASPRHIDVIHSGGVTDTGIYELDGTVLKIAFAAGRRPADFQSAGSSGVVITYKKGA